MSLPEIRGEGEQQPGQSQAASVGSAIHWRLEAQSRQGEVLSVARLRRAGGYVTRLDLHSKAHGRQERVLYAPEDLTTPRLDATFVMTPVGPDATGDFGGRHGHVRSVEHEELGMGMVLGGSAESLAARPQSVPGRPDVQLTHVLTPNSLMTAICLRNNTGAGLDTSLGVHYFFNLPEGGPGDVRLGGEKIDELLRPGAAALVTAGEAQFWPWSEGVDGEVDISFPDGREVNMFMQRAVNSETETMPPGGVLIWQRPGQPSICIEPVVGVGPNYTPDTNNTGLHLPPAHDFSMASAVTLR